MAYVRSVETKTFTVANGVTSYDVELSKGQVVENCVPFISKEFTALGTTNDWQSTQFQISFVAPNICRFQRITSASDQKITLTVTEFDPRYVKIQQVQNTMPSGLIPPVHDNTIEKVDTSKTFLVCHSRCSIFTINAVREGMIAPSFLDDTTVRVAKANNQGTVYYNVYVVEALDEQFDVQTTSVTMTFNDQIKTAVWATPVDVRRSFIIEHTYSSINGGVASLAFATRFINVASNQSDTLTTRKWAQVFGEFSVGLFQIIQLNESGDNVQRRRASYATGVDTYSAQLTAGSIDTDKAFVICPYQWVDGYATTDIDGWILRGTRYTLSSGDLYGSRLGPTGGYTALTTYEHPQIIEFGELTNPLTITSETSATSGDAPDPRDPETSIDVTDTLPARTTIKRIKRQLFHLGEDYEDPKVQFKYYRNMAARYGDAFVIARRQDGTLWSWGCSASIGQLGQDGVTPTATPTQVAGSIEFSRVFAPGRAHTVALDTRGRAWTFGDNQYGQLGDYTSTDKSSPVAVEEWMDYVYRKAYKAAAAGWGHSIVIDENDKVWAWGGNWYGQLGDGTSTNKSSPVGIVQGDTRRFRKIDAGDEHTVALDQHSQLFAWGRNADGQLGDGTTTDSVNPIKIEQEGTPPIISFDFRDSIVSNNNDWVGNQSGFATGGRRFASGAFPTQWVNGYFEYVEGITEVDWNLPTVKSVEYFFFTLGGGQVNSYQTVSKGQNLDNCVPFLAGVKHETPGSTNFNRDFVRIALEDEQQFRNNKVRCSAGPDGGTALDVGVYLVEFNTARVRVQQGRFDKGGQSMSGNIDSVNTSKSFIHISWRCEGTDNKWRDAMVRARITSPTTIVIDRFDGGGDMDVRWWVVESLDDSFDVETVEWQHLQSGSGDMYGANYSSPVVGNNTNYNRAICLVTCRNNQSGNTVDKQPAAWFSDSDGKFYSKANNNPSIPGRVVDYVGQVITFNDASKNLNAQPGPAYIVPRLNFGEFPRSVPGANLLTQDFLLYFPGAISGSELMYPNPEHSMVYSMNPQGMAAAIGYSSETHYLDSNRFLFTYNDATLTATRGDVGGGTCWVQAFEFDNFDETSISTIRTANPKTRTFGALDGTTAQDGFGVPINLSTSRVKVVAEGISGLTGKISGSNPWSFKFVIKTPAVGLGSTGSQTIWSYGGTFNIHGTPAASTIMRVVYLDNRSGSQLGTMTFSNGGASWDYILGNFFEPETWYTIYITSDGVAENNYYIINMETDEISDFSHTLPGSLNIVASTLLFFGTGFTTEHMWVGILDSWAGYDSVIVEGEVIEGAGDVGKQFIELAAGSMSSYGIDILGRAWGWGDNTYGQVGDSTTDDKSIPVSVAGRHSFIQVAAGGRIEEGHACALKPDGSIWCWGRNHYGQLGVCDEVDRSSPASVIGNHSFIDLYVSKGGFQTIAIKLDGSVWVWGKDPFCDGTNYCSPVSVPDFNLILLNILGRGYFSNHSNLLRLS